MMTGKKSYHAWITLLNAFLFFGTVTLAAEETLPENQRDERAILGLFSANDIVGGGAPGRDFPALSSVPRTDFSCRSRAPGYYADEEFGCQVFHVCHADHRKDSFLCPNGTIFHQLRLVCDWWYNVDCSTSDLHVSVNNNIGKLTPRQKVNRVSVNNDVDRSTSFRGSSRDFGRPFDSHSDFGLNIHRNEFATTVLPHSSGIRDNFGVSLQPFSNLGGNTINDNFHTFARTEKPLSLHSLQFPPSLQTLSQTFAPLSPTTPIPFTTRKFESSSFGVPLRTTNVTPRTSFLTSPSRGFSPPPQVNRILSSASPKFGVDLPLRTNNLNDFRDDSFVLFDNKNAFVSTGVPLPPAQNFQDSIVPPEHFTVPKPKSPSRTFTNQNSFGGRGTTERVSNVMRVKVNKRPITSSVQFEVPRNDQHFGSRNHFRPQVNFNRISDLDDDDEVVILDDDEISTQFFNIGSPRRVANRQPFSTPVGRPLPALEIHTNNDRREDTFGFPLQSANINNNNNQNDIQRNTIGVPLPPVSTTSNINTNDRRSDTFGLPLQSPNINQNQNDFPRNSIGVPLPPARITSNINTNNRRGNTFGRPLQPANINTNNQNVIQRQSTGVPLPPVSTTSNINANQLSNKVGISLSEANQRARNHFRTTTGHSHPVFNRINTSFRLRSSEELGRNNLRSNINANRGSTTFLNSQKNRASIQNLLNHQVRGNAVTGSQSSSGFVATFDDDALDDLDDLNDPFDDDRFDNDRFDLDDRFDDDRFDDDRFDNDKFDLDDRFDDDRFDLDDRFDDDRIDDDRFELDDRFDDLDDRFDLDDRHDDDRFDKDLFDFDDEIDNRRHRFGNSAGFNFGRRARGSVFQTGNKNEATITNDENVESEGNDPIAGIEPPSEIQLPPPPL